MATAQTYKNPFKANAISKLLIKFSAPAIAGMFVNALYNIISRVYVGRSLGALGIAGISILFPLALIFMAVSMLVGVGANALFSIRLGERNEEQAQLILGNAFVLLILLGLALTGLSYLFMDPVLSFFGADPAVLPYARDYTMVVLPGYLIFTVGAGLNNFIRSSGHPKTAMATQLIGAAINLAVGPIFIFGLGWGMKGAAMATVCGQLVSFLWVLFFFTSSRSRYRLRFKYMKLNRAVVQDSLIIGFSQFAFQIASSTLNIILNHSLLKYGGNVAISAIGIAISVNTIFVMPLIGLSQGAQPLIGYNYGARKFTTSIQTLKMAIKWGTIITGIGFVIIELFATPIVSIFNSTDRELIEMSSYAVRVLNLMIPVLGFQVLATSFFQAINQPLKAAVLSLSRQVLLIIPLVLILPLFFGLHGVFFAPPVADVISTIIALRMLKKYFDRHKQNFFFSTRHTRKKE